MVWRVCPPQGEFRANLAAGGRGVVQPLSEREWWIVEQVKPLIAEQKLYLAGLDVIGGYLTELNRHPAHLYARD